MAEVLSPIALLEQANLSDNLADIQDDSDSPDANWLSAQSNNTTSTVRIRFAAPSTNPSGAQSFRLLVRPSNSPGANNPTWSMNLYQNGVDLGQIASGTLDGANKLEELVAGSWDASSLNDASGANVEVRWNCIGQGGSPSNRNTGELGASEWIAEVASAQDLVGSDSAAPAWLDSGDASQDQPLVASDVEAAGTRDTDSASQDQPLGAADVAGPSTSDAGGLIQDQTLVATTGVGAATLPSASLGSPGTSSAWYLGSFDAVGDYADSFSTSVAAPTLSAVDASAAAALDAVTVSQDQPLSADTPVGDADLGAVTLTQDQPLAGDDLEFPGRDWTF